MGCSPNKPMASHDTTGFFHGEDFLYKKLLMSLRSLFAYLCFENMLGDLGQGPNGFGRKTQLHSADALGLDVDLESAPGVTLGVANFVAGLGSTTG